MLRTSQSQTRLLFEIYVCTAGLIFYCSLFRRTIKLAMGMPTHMLKKESVHAIVEFVLPAGGSRDEEEAEPEERGSRSPIALGREV